MTRRTFVLALTISAAALSATAVQAQAIGESAFLASVGVSGDALPVASTAATAHRTQAVLDALVAGDREALFAAAPARRAETYRADWGRMLDRFEEQGALRDARVLSVEVRPDGKALVRARALFGDTPETLRMVWTTDGGLVLLTRGVSGGC